MKLESVKTLVAGAALPEPYNFGWNSEKPEFGEIVRTAGDPKLIVEVGTFLGQSALRLAELCPNAITICVDTWLASVEMATLTKGVLQHGYPALYLGFLANVARSPYADRIFPFPQTSRNAARLLKKLPERPQVCFIDGSHEHPDVYEDAVDYFNLLAPGGLFFGDDFESPAHPAVAPDIRRFTEERQLSLTTKGGFWATTKPL